MIITDYRVQSILRTYTRQLQRSKLAATKTGQEMGDQKQSTEKVSISDEARRRIMMERLTNQVFERVYTKEEENGAETTASEQDTQTASATKGNP